jgi:hypothetical protein
MKPRTQLSVEERTVRSRLRLLLADAQPFIHGTLIEMARVCGNPNCRCAREGAKHRSLYVGRTRQRKTRMQYVPKAREAQACAGVARYDQARALLDELGEQGLESLRHSDE